MKQITFEMSQLPFESIESIQCSFDVRLTQDPHTKILMICI